MIKKNWKKIILAIIIVGIIAIYFFNPTINSTVNYAIGVLMSGNIDRVVAYIRSYGNIAAVISFSLMVLQSVISPIPAFLITFANAMIFGWWKGAILSFTSSMVGAVLCFYIARVFGRDIVVKFTSNRALNEIEKYFDKYGSKTILICRLLPFISFDLVSYFAGLTSMTLPSFLIATGIGQLPATIIYSYVGGMLTGGAKLFVTALFLLFALSILVMMMKQIFNERNKKMSLKRLSIKINQDFAFSKFMMRGKKSKSIFFPGCSFMKFGNDIIYKTLDILRLEDENIEVCSLCCAYPSQVLDKEYYKNNREKIVKFFKDRDVEKIYVACPNCYNMLEKLKNEYNLNFSIIMIYKILNEKLSNMDSYYPINDEVVIHDPCVIRKDIETQNTVREILEKIGQKYVEPLNTKDKTVCCGNINMTHVLKPEVANKVCKSRVNELSEKSKTIMSYCNGCLYAFKKQKAKTIHIIELIFGKQDRDTFYKRIKFTKGLNKC